MLKTLISFIFVFVGFVSVKAQEYIPKFENSKTPNPPDYKQLTCWAAHPSKKDNSDIIPHKIKKNEKQRPDNVNVFFVHPTIFTEKVKDDFHWNACINNKKLNNKIDNSTIKLQSTIFNNSGEIYAPRYRQAHIRSFFEPNKKEGDKALDLAYEDVKNAFKYFLEESNNPFIIAGHSQGARHIIQLLKDFIDGKKLKEKLIAAYIVGWGVDKNEFNDIPLSNSASEIGCFVTWRTYAKGILPKWVSKNDVCTNPLNWKSDSTYADYSTNKGAILMNLNKSYKSLFDAQVYGPVLWVGRPKIAFGKLLERKDYHIGDLNLFYRNVRENARLRVDTYLKRHQSQ